MSFLETLNLKTVIFIGGQIPSNFFKEFFETSAIEWFVIKTSGDSSSLIAPDQKNAKSQDTKTITGTNYCGYTLCDLDDLMLIKSQSIQRILKLLLDVSYHNVLLVDKTSVVIGLLRKIQKWDLSSIISEYRLFTGKNKNYFAETFLELISIKLIQEDNEDEDDTLSSNVEHLNIIEEKTRNNSIDDSLSLQQVIKESDLSMPPELPKRMMNIIQDMELKPDDTRDPIPSIPSALGIFGNKYRLAFNKRERGDYEYYQSFKPNAFVFTVPKESLLPSWFKFQRDLWDQQHSVEENQYYKESIFTV